MVRNLLMPPRRLLRLHLGVHSGLVPVQALEPEVSARVELNQIHLVGWAAWVVECHQAEALEEWAVCKATHMVVWEEEWVAKVRCQIPR